jgi:hypothetical protein
MDINADDEREEVAPTPTDETLQGISLAHEEIAVQQRSEVWKLLSLGGTGGSSDEEVDVFR